jgi:hypothetical protein
MSTLQNAQGVEKTNSVELPKLVEKRKSRLPNRLRGWLTIAAALIMLRRSTRLLRSATSTIRALSRFAAALASLAIAVQILIVTLHQLAP